jgi:hypothetical protein
MFGRFAVIWAVITAAIAAGVGAIAYNAGLAANVAAHGGEVVAPYPYYGGYGWGFGFGWIIPLLLFILLLRFAFGRRHWYGGGHRGGWGGWDDRLQDWHRQAHGEQSQQPSPPSNAS